MFYHYYLYLNCFDYIFLSAPSLNKQYIDYHTDDWMYGIFPSLPLAS